VGIQTSAGKPAECFFYEFRSYLVLFSSELGLTNVLSVYIFI